MKYQWGTEEVDKGHSCKETNRDKHSMVQLEQQILLQIYKGPCRHINQRFLEQWEWSAWWSPTFIGDWTAFFFSLDMITRKTFLCYSSGLETLVITCRIQQWIACKFWDCIYSFLLMLFRRIYRKVKLECCWHRKN